MRAARSRDNAPSAARTSRRRGRRVSAAHRLSRRCVLFAVPRLERLCLSCVLSRSLAVVGASPLRSETAFPLARETSANHVRQGATAWPVESASSSPRNSAGMQFSISRRRLRVKSQLSRRHHVWNHRHNPRLGRVVGEAVGYPGIGLETRSPNRCRCCSKVSSVTPLSPSFRLGHGRRGCRSTLRRHRSR